MKVHPNDNIIKSLKDITKETIHKISYISSPNNHRITSPIFRANKTIQKYINERLNSIKKTSSNNIKEISLNKKKQPKLNYKKHPNLIKRKLIINPKPKNSNKYIDIIKNIKNKGKKSKENIFKIKDNNIINYKNNNNNKSKNISNYHSNKSLNIILKNKQNSKESKLINSMSTSSGVSICSNDNKKYIPFLNNDISTQNYLQNNNTNNNTNIDDKNLDLLSNINFLDYRKQFAEETSRHRHNINNFNYESGSDDNLSENKIFLKCDNNSLLTFGNSFSYSNTKRSKSTRKTGNNEDNDENKNKIYCKDLIINYNNKSNLYVNRLKEENETLKKELKESSEQISLLKYQINELKCNKNYCSKKFIKNNKICSPNIWKKRKFPLIEKENKTNNNNDNNNNDKCLFIKIEYDKMRVNKDILKDINKTIIDKNFKNSKKKIIIKRKLNLNGKNKKYKNNSVCVEDRLSDNLDKYISKLKI